MGRAALSRHHPHGHQRFGREPSTIERPFCSQKIVPAHAERGFACASHPSLSTRKGSKKFPQFFITAREDRSPAAFRRTLPVRRLPSLALVVAARATTMG